MAYSFTAQPYTPLSRSDPDSTPFSARRDVEAGSSALAAPSRVLRVLMTRKARLILALSAACGMAYMLYDSAGHGYGYGLGGDGGGAQWPIAPESNGRKVSETEYIVDDRGDHFYPFYPQPNIPSFDPDLTLLPAPKDLFNEIDIPRHLEPPETNPFPDSRYRDVHSPPSQTPDEEVKYRVLPEAYAKTWEAPEGWDDEGEEMPSVQWEGFKKGGYETSDERDVREARREAVRRGFVHAWQAYKDYAWGHDEVRPVSKVPSDPFNSWGASIVDTLDTLLLMGLPDEYNLCRPHVNQLNFHWIHGNDWADGYVFEPELIPASASKQPVVQTRDRTGTMGVFETGIRYLGGLLGGYDLSGDQLLLDRAVELAGVLAKAFNTSSGLPIGHMNPGSVSDFRLETVSSAEVGSMSLELIHLGQLTGDRQWFDLAQRATEYIAERVAPRSIFDPMLPLTFQPDQSVDTKMAGTFAWGGLIDSYYEYLIKVYHLLRGSPVSAVYRDLYERSVDVSRDIIFRRSNVTGKSMLIIGKHEFNHFLAEIEHLTCFAGAMLGLGSRLLSRHTDFIDAQDITKTCYWLSAATATGMQPENVEFYDIGQQNVMWENVTLPVKTESNPTGRLSEGLYEPTPYGAGTEPKKYYQRLKGDPAGTKRIISPRVLNRPETIESIFYMYRLTGDKKWQDRGWAMFVAWTETAKIPGGGMSSLQDAMRNRGNTVYTDNMESFTFAETFKYHLLLQSDPDLLSLDDYVLNTEAHPFLTKPHANPGHSNLWPGPPPASDPSADLGHRAQGTDVQKWIRLAVLDRTRQRFKRERAQAERKMEEAEEVKRHGESARAVLVPVPEAKREEGRDRREMPVGGRGMGGGWGNPRVRPKPPIEFLEGSY